MAEGRARMVLMCMPWTAEFAARGGTPDKCADCGVQIIVSRGGRATLAQHPEMVPICGECAKIAQEQHPASAYLMSHEAIRELAEYEGLTVEQIEKILQEMAADERLGENLAETFRRVRRGSDN